MIDRKLYKGYFLKEDMNSWVCPKCNKGTLQVSKDKFLFDENSTTKQFSSHEDFNLPMDIIYTYTALLTCTNPKCNEVVTSSGTGGVDVIGQTLTPEGYTNTEYGDYFQPRYFYPPLQIFKIPDATPEEIKQAIETSFSLVFNNKSAAANQIRIALECLLTQLKVKRFNTRTGHRRTRLNLHQRIGLLPAKYQEVKDVCFAIKWLGNSGSHCDEDMKFNDVFDGYDMLSFVLDEIYDNRHNHVKKLAKTINAKKGV